VGDKGEERQRKTKERQRETKERRDGGEKEERQRETQERRDRVRGRGETEGREAEGIVTESEIE
jgi:hypothetical protein